jgi:hypothetical protein
VEHEDSSPFQQYIVMGDHLHSSSNYMSDDGGRVIDQQVVELLTVVPNGWSLVMSIDDYSPWVPVDEILVKSLGLTKAYDISQVYRKFRTTWIWFHCISMISIILSYYGSYFN